jgi:prepilin peptidase CpaA
MHMPSRKQNAMPPDADDISRLLSIAAFSLLAVAALHDLGFRTLPDTVSMALLGCGLGIHILAGDLGMALLATVAVFAFALVTWSRNWLGGGDAKLLGATALAVPLAGIPTLLLGTALAGGILALGFLALRPLVPAIPGPRPAALLARALRAEAWRIRRRGPLPYAVAIATGGVASLLNG